MATAKKDLEISLESLSLTADTLGGDSRREATFTLVSPRLSIAQKVNSKTLRLVGGAWRSEGGPWARKVLFKESVQGSTGIEVEISGHLSDSDVEALSRSSASAAVKLLGGLAADAVPGGKIAASLSEIPISAIAKLLSGSGAGNAEVEGVADIPEAIYAGLAAGESATLEVPLVARHDISKTVRRSDKSGTTARRRTVVAEGARVGCAVLSIKAL